MAKDDVTTQEVKRCKRLYSAQCPHEVLSLQLRFLKTVSNSECFALRVTEYDCSPKELEPEQPELGVSSLFTQVQCLTLALWEIEKVGGDRRAA